MDQKTLSTLLGHYSVSFTMDTYAHVLDEQKWQGMSLMEDLYSIDQTAAAQQLYPILLTPDVRGGYVVTAPDFPQVQLYAATMEQGITMAQQTLQDILLTEIYPPAATDLNSIVTQNGQFALQVAV